MLVHSTFNMHAYGSWTFLWFKLVIKQSSFLSNSYIEHYLSVLNRQFPETLLSHKIVDGTFE